MPLNQLATVTVPESRMLSVQVWDRSLAGAVEKAIRDSGLGLNPAGEGAVIRVPLPELNEERRRELTKVAHKYAEDARVAVRHVRRDGMDLLKKLEKDGDIGQDEGRSLGEQVQKATDARGQRDRQHPRRQGTGNNAGLSCLLDLRPGRATQMSSDPAIKTAPGRRPALRIPEHIGVIMDGNGRWAQARGKPRTEGHVAGVKALRRMVELCIRYGVGHLTVFSFSSENWRRPPEEVSFIFGLLHRFVASDLAAPRRQQRQVRIIGDRDGLDASLQRLIADVERKTAGNTGLQLVVAFNYGGKAEITEATRQIARAVAAGLLKPEDITEHTIQAALYTAGLPDPDLIIRTSGEQRFSQLPALAGAPIPSWSSSRTTGPISTRTPSSGCSRNIGMRERRFGGVEARGR